MEKNTKENARTSKWKWKRIRPDQASIIPSPCHLHSLVHHNNLLYLFGGFGDGDKYFNDFWQFSLEKLQWKKMKSKIRPTARHSHQAVVYQDKMILFGGISEGKATKDLWSYSFETNCWQQQEQTTLPAVWGHSMIVFDDKLVIFGGADKKSKVTNNFSVLDARTLEVVDVNVSNEILPSPRQYASITCDGDSIYLFGGFNNKSLQDCYKISITREGQIVITSISVPSFVPSLRGASLSHLNQSQLLLFGGRTNQQLNHVTYSLDLETLTWGENESVGPGPRYYHQTCHVNGELIMHGGLGIDDGSDKATNLNDMWCYSDDNVRPFMQEGDKPQYDLELPPEVWGLVCNHLHSGRNCVSASIVSKQFYMIMTTNENLKKNIERYALCRNMSLPVINKNFIKLAFVGAGGCGKSATAIQYFNGRFVEEYDPTLEDNWRQQYPLDDKIVLLEITDTASYDEYPLYEMMYASLHGLYLVYSITDKKTLTDLDTHFDAARRAKRNKKFPAIVVGNKSDLEAQRQVTQAEGQEYAKRNNALWIETSAKTPHNIDKALEMLIRLIFEADEVRPRDKRDAQNTQNTTGSQKSRCLTM